MKIDYLSMRCSQQRKVSTASGSHVTLIGTRRVAGLKYTRTWPPQSPIFRHVC